MEWLFDVVEAGNETITQQNTNDTTNSNHHHQYKSNNNNNSSFFFFFLSHLLSILVGFKTSRLLMVISSLINLRLPPHFPNLSSIFHHPPRRGILDWFLDMVMVIGFMKGVGLQRSKFRMPMWLGSGCYDVIFEIITL